MFEIPKTLELFELGRTVAEELYDFEYAHEALSEIGNIIEAVKKRLGDGFFEMKEGVYVSRSAKISDSCEIDGPAIICEDAQIRHGALIRGKVIVGRGAVIGNSSEVKNSILFDSAKLPHYNYAGDSILGYGAHLGAGAIISNLRLDGKEIRLRSPSGEWETGLRKFGAIVGDSVEVGCGAVICPGSYVGRGAMIYPLSRVMGVIPRDKVYNGESITEKRNGGVI